MARKQLVIGAAVGAILGGLLTTPYVRSLAAVPFFQRDTALLGHRAFLVAGVACWALFGLYWEYAAKNASAAQKSEARTSRGVHVFLANVALLLEIAPIRGLGRFAPASALLMTVGLGLEALGLAVAIWARRQLGRHWSGEITIKVEHELIRTGPYQLARHPIYTGLLAMYAGIALLTGEWLAVVGLAMALFAYWRKIRMEEAALDQAFGAQYEAYRRTTRALVPGLL